MAISRKEKIMSFVEELAKVAKEILEAEKEATREIAREILHKQVAWGTWQVALVVGAANEGERKWVSY